ncbi:MAG: TonB-dependent receptor [Novosphingobium sp.]|nr:TonB-dependent receptor [Novosphingobium sp.]
MSRLKWIVAAGALAISFSYSPLTLAQDGNAADMNNFSDIVVTARRSEEQLQDVPISITVFTQEQISNRNIILASDLAAFTPSLSINQRYGPEKSPSRMWGLRARYTFVR